MSEFSLTLTLDTGLTYSELIERPEERPLTHSWLKRTVAKLRGQELPATFTVPVLVSVDMPHLYTMELSEETDVYEFEERITTALDRLDHSIVSMVWDLTFRNVDLLQETYSPPTCEELINFVTCIVDGDTDANAFAAAVTEYGWDTGHLSEDWMEDNYRGVFESPAAYAENLAADVCEIDTPDWVVIDWDASAEQLGYDDDYVTFDYMTHVFYRHG